MPYFIELNLYLLIIGLCYQFGFKKLQNFKFGRPFLLLGTTASFLLPLLKTEKLAAASEYILQDSYIMEVVTVHAVQEVSFGFQLIATAILILVAAICLTKTFIGFIKLLKLKSKSIKEKDFYLIPDSKRAFSFLNNIFIGEQIPEQKRNLIYAHELVHSKKAHSLDILFIQLVKIVVWHNPVIYFIESNLKELHEFEADQISIKEETTYIDLLLQQNFENFNLSFIHQFNSNHIKNRIMRIQMKNNRKPSKPAVLFTIGLLIGSIAISQSAELIKQEPIINLSELSNITELGKLSELSKINLKGEVDKKAEYPGGQAAMMKFLGKEIVYPKVAKNEKSEGTVYTSFVVGADGVCKDFKIKKGVSEALDQAAIHALKKMPKWIPAVKDGKNVAMELTIPVKFVLPPPPPAPSIAPKPTKEN